METCSLSASLVHCWHTCSLILEENFWLTKETCNLLEKGLHSKYFPTNLRHFPEHLFCKTHASNFSAKVNSPCSTETAARGVLWKKVFLETSQNSLENTCARVSLAQVFSFEFCEISKNTFLIVHLWVTASGSSRHEKTDMAMKFKLPFLFYFITLTLVLVRLVWFFSRDCLTVLNRSSSEMFSKKDVLKNFAKLKVKQLQ